MPHIELPTSLTYDMPSGQVPGVAAISFNIEASEFLHRRPLWLRQVDLAQHHRGLLDPPAVRDRIGGKAVTGHGLDRGVVFQDFAQLFPVAYSARQLSQPPSVWR